MSTLYCIYHVILLFNYRNLGIDGRRRIQQRGWLTLQIHVKKVQNVVIHDFNLAFFLNVPKNPESLPMPE